ncbi:MAG TPA: 16S rRNA (adenine(1518)-N(6)/adenine(1519)-N(6))-dimethyltransferase RsmA [Gammaproteobacteria bacterium]|nr:16S rRNA (adenine(1518)-N(6)/adenine(1519)-N(6))-dimethyltransferase RsmA [Gammaproteobacteria bacterium]
MNSFKHQPRKRFGQNFLHDANILRNMVQAIQPEPGQTLVEIGPGRGALTFLLLDKARKLTVIELDRDLITPLEQQAKNHGELEIFSADALRFDFSKLAHDSKPLRVVGNLPYNISTPLLFHLLKQTSLISDMHFLLQKEVVDRLAASPRSKDYGRLSIMVQYHCRVEPLFTVGPGAFTPAPKVDSAFVRLVPHQQYPYSANDLRTLENLVRQAFTQRRKMLRRSLKEMVTTKDFEAAEITPEKRAEELTVGDFVRLSNIMEKRSLKKND